MARVLLVPPLPLERLAALDKYAHRLYDWLESSAQGFEVRLAASIGELTRAEREPGRSSGGFARWWTQPVDPSKLVMPGPLYGPHRWAARYFLYPRRVARAAAQSLSPEDPQGVAAGAELHRGHRVVEARARDVAGRRAPYSRGAVRRGPRILLGVAGRARPRARRLAHSRRRVRRAARRVDGRSQ